MAKKVQKKTNKRVPSKPSEPRVKDFLDLIAPTAVKFNTDHYICGGTYRCTLALRSYPASTFLPLMPLGVKYLKGFSL